MSVLSTRGAARVLAFLLVLLTAVAAPASAETTADAGVVNINTASLEQLTLLPGIGATRAQRIVEYRASKPFKRAVELARVKGIGLKMVRALKPWLAVEGPTTMTRKPARPTEDASTK